MAKAADKRLLDVLSQYEEDPKEAMWDCHGTWVIYHKAIERIAAKAKITFEMPEVVEARAADRVAVIIARGFMGDRSEWSFGEAAPNNNKNAYPFAMAEKRAKDRVVLKLVGLHGLAYSEEESDDFKREPRTTDQRSEAGRQETRTSSASLKRDGVWAEFQQELEECKTVQAITKLALAWSTKAENDKWPTAWKEAAREEMEKRRDAIKSEIAQQIDDDTFPPDRANGNSYINAFQAG